MNTSKTKLPTAFKGESSTAGITSGHLSEERFDRVISEVEDCAIILLDPQGIVTTWNMGAERIKGYRSVEIIGRSHRVFYPSEDILTNLPGLLLSEAFNKGKATYDGWLIKKDGSRYWGNVDISALHSKNREVTGFLNFTRDLTERINGFSKVTKDLTERKINEDRYSIITQELKLKIDELKDSEERYHLMIAEVQDYAIILLNTLGEVQNWNAGAALIKGYKANEIVGKNFKVFYTPEDIERGYPDKLLKEAETNGRASSEGWRIRKDGSRFWGSIVITALHHSEGGLIGFSKVTRDLTERKRDEDILKNQSLELALSNFELEKLNRELTSFAYVVSHDFKEPIRKIQVFGNRQLELGKTTEQIQEYAEKIISSAAKMQALMGALLSYSLVSNDPAESENADLNEALESAKVDLELKISETNATIDSVRLPTIKGIAFQFHQMFLNLLSNALKFAKPNESPSITILYKIMAREELPEELIVKNKTYCEITFADKGIGFEPGQSSRIFDVFQRLRPKSDLNGTGIGLAIVKRIVMNHDGFVVAKSNPNEGAVFKIYLPGME